MCQATIYMVRDRQRQEIMRQVTRLVLVDEGVQLEAFFEPPRTVAGRITEIDFLKHTVTLAPLEEQGA